MDAREEFERIKGNTKDLRKAMIELGQYPRMNERDLKDIETLINIIDTLEKKSKQDNETIKYYLNSQYGKEVTNKVQMSSLYGQYHQIYKNVTVRIETIDDYFKTENVDVRITDKILIVEDKKVTTFYDINKIEYFSITQNESEVEQ